ncbi:hypothetical protein M752DRAFT_300018 [Aspergillus phoenicis ATCC 13157]|uniref:Uncharacterized protein n=2 Tax=Aspergillus TaxID=5052 RepID=A0A370Q172_ASPPH|nr:hypothetical protein M747DRAFT_302718 [Aspergillus niger ATCC 13496]RDK48191.1 hypothetical protein M752DRAFT_300018 [Aspergillus phoenicis ATCC 13157]
MDSEECELVYVGKISGRSKRWDDEGSHAGTSQSHTRLGCAQGRGRWADAPIDNECAPPSRWESVGAIDEPDNEERSPSSSEGGSPTKGIQSITKKGLNSQGIRCHSFPGIKWGRNMNDYYYFDGNGKVC